MTGTFTLPVDHMCTAISYGYASPSLSHITEDPVAFEISLLLRTQLIRQALTFGCYAPGWREQSLLAAPPLYPETTIVIECKSQSL
ncbi:MAG TPA: hypothetical protein EYG65_11430 [Rhodospirillales bacterium]|nr:hypothetical protein [Rhodospirillales bacterium]